VLLYPAWAPDGKRIAVICAKQREPAICLVTVRDGRVATIVPPGAPGLGGLDWSPDGRRIVFMGGDPEAPDVCVVGVDARAAQADRR
jgi:Tol biopolymer transport system component